MEYANAEIRLSGSLENTVVKEVSASEIPIIKQLHGADAVLNVKKSRVDKIDLAEERIRLDITYKPDVVSKVYAGTTSRLFETLEEVGYADEDAPVAAKKAK
jgi:hypothetical protein